MRKTWIAIWLLVAVPAWGQVNTEKMRKERDTSGFAGEMKAEVTLAAGNSEFVQIDLGPSFVWREGKHQIFSINELSSVETEGRSIVNAGFSHVRYNYRLSPTLVYELFAQAQYNRAQNLDRRYLGGTGVRIRALDRERARMAVGVALMFEHESLEDGTSADLWRSSNYLSLRWTRSDVLKLAATVYLQPALENLGDVRILEEAELSVALADNLAITIALNYRYDSEPPVDVRRWDLKLKNGLKISF